MVDIWQSGPARQWQGITVTDPFVLRADGPALEIDGMAANVDVSVGWDGEQWSPLRLDRGSDAVVNQRSRWHLSRHPPSFAHNTGRLPQIAVVPLPDFGNPNMLRHMEPRQPAVQRLAEVLLGPGELDRIVSELRAADASWRVIARTIYNKTGGEVDVTGETVRRWYSERASA
jgi:hypothetical protein